MIKHSFFSVSLSLILCHSFSFWPTWYPPPSLLVSSTLSDEKTFIDLSIIDVLPWLYNVKVESASTECNRSNESSVWTSSILKILCDFVLPLVGVCLKLQCFDVALCILTRVYLLWVMSITSLHTHTNCIISVILHNCKERVSLHKMLSSSAAMASPSSALDSRTKQKPKRIAQLKTLSIFKLVQDVK